MASKILTGNMPEIMENILNNLDEFYSLYSCALVSRHWCEMSIPILWQDPFSFDKNSKFISRYFSSLNDDEKLTLKECGIIANFPNTIFTYAKFLKVLDLISLEEMVKRWIYSQTANLPQHINILKYHVSNILIKLFIENGATLSKLDLVISECHVEIKPEIFYALGRNELFFSRLQELSIDIISEFSIESATTLLRILAKNTTKISNLRLYQFDSNFATRVCNALICVINSQEQLKRIDFIGEGFSTKFCGIVSALESQKKSLQEVTIDNCACDADFKVLMNCENLEILRIRQCEVSLLKSLDTNLYKICTLELIYCQIDDKSFIRQIIEKSGPLLQRLRIIDEMIRTQSLLEALMTFCPNIAYLHISAIKFSVQLLKLISSLRKLKFLTILWINDGTEEVTKTRVMQFAEILPSTLEYLDLTDIWKNSYIDILLNHCNAPLKKLLFRYDDCNYEKKIEALIGFCMRKRSLDNVNLSKAEANLYISISSDIIVFKNCCNKFKKDLEGYAELVPYSDIFVDC